MKCVLPPRASRGMSSNSFNFLPEQSGFSSVGFLTSPWTREAKMWMAGGSVLGVFSFGTLLQGGLSNTRPRKVEFEQEELGEPPVATVYEWQWTAKGYKWVELEEE